MTGNSFFDPQETLWQTFANSYTRDVLSSFRTPVQEDFSTIFYPAKVPVIPQVGASGRHDRVF